jgi:hypothetical protein
MKDDKISKENEFQPFYSQTYVNTSDLMSQNEAKPPILTPNNNANNQFSSLNENKFEQKVDFNDDTENTIQESDTNGVKKTKKQTKSKKLKNELSVDVNIDEFNETNLFIFQYHNLKIMKRRLFQTTFLK